MNIIHKLRKERCWSQTELAKKLGWAQADVSRAESGQTALTLPKLQKLAKVFGVKPSCLIDETSFAEMNTQFAEPATTGKSVPRDPLLDQIMTSAYTLWYNAPDPQRPPIEQLPELVYVCYNRMQDTSRPRRQKEIDTCLADMLAALAPEIEPKTRRKAR